MNCFRNIGLCLLLVGVILNVAFSQSSWDYSGLKSPADLILAQEKFLEKNNLEVDKKFFHDYYENKLLYYYGKEYDFPEYFGKTMEEHLANGVAYPKEDDVFYFEKTCLIDSEESSMSFESWYYRKLEEKEREALFHNSSIEKPKSSTSRKKMYIVADNLELFNNIQLRQEIIGYLKKYYKEDGKAWERELGCTFYFSLKTYEQHSENDFLHVEVYKIEVYPKGYNGEPLLTYILDKEAVENSSIKEKYEKKVVNKHSLPYNFTWLDGDWKYSSNDTDYEFSMDKGSLSQKIESIY